MEDFIWNEDLSPNAQKLYLFLIGDTGYVDTLPIIAAEEGIDLHAGLEELRRHQVLDESDPEIILINIFNH